MRDLFWLTKEQLALIDPCVFITPKGRAASMVDVDTGHTAKQPYWASMNEPGGSYSGHSLRARASSRNGERDLHSVNFAHTPV